MINEHLGGVECRSPSTPPRIHDSFRTFPVRVPAALGAPRSGIRPLRGPAPRPPPGPVAPCSAHSGLCAGLLRCARALRPGFASGARSPVASAARRRPRRPGWLPLAPLRGRCRFRSALSRSPAVRGPPARAPGAAVRPRRVPLRGARRICPGFGRRSSPPGGLNPAALGALALLARLFSLRAAGPPAVLLLFGCRQYLRQLCAASPRGIQSVALLQWRQAATAYMRAAIALASPH